MAKLGQKTLVLIVIVSMQVCSLDAKSIMVGRRSSVAVVDNFGGDDRLSAVITRNSRETVSVGSSCLPDHNQLEYYAGLYSSNAANSFNGNIQYYTVKAMETHFNRTRSTANPTVTREDYKVLANINDHSRFTPAGMETVNKAICAKILQEMDAEANLFSTTALCAWDYICDYRADRFPHYLFKARCKTSKCSGNCNSQGSSTHNMCQSHGIHVTILEMRDNCGEWVWGQELLPLACTCTNDVMMKASS